MKSKRGRASSEWGKRPLATGYLPLAFATKYNFPVLLLLPEQALWN